MSSMRLSLSILVMLIVSQLSAQMFSTFTYFRNDTISLDLDLFLPDNQAAPEEAVPLVIYVHGGGFGKGNRDGGHNLARHLVQNNIACATITYTLYMQDKSFSCDGILSEKIRAIQIAASQLWHATSYLLERSEEFHVDGSKIFIAGSSAGAETVLHAAYWDRGHMQLFGRALSPDFSYAGVISGAGAIMDLNLITEGNMLPTMLFHGDADPVVPYDIAAHHHCPPDSPGWLMLFGSQAIADHLRALGESSELISFKGGNHSFAGAYFYQDQEPVAAFINRVLSGGRFNISLEVVPE